MMYVLSWQTVSVFIPRCFATRKIHKHFHECRNSLVTQSIHHSPYIYISWWDTITNTCANFKGCPVKLPLQLGYAWVITPPSKKNNNNNNKKTPTMPCNFLIHTLVSTKNSLLGYICFCMCEGTNVYVCGSQLHAHENDLFIFAHMDKAPVSGGIIHWDKVRLKLSVCGFNALRPR